MFIVLRQYEINAFLRRPDVTDWNDLTKARVIENSLRFSEDKIESTLEAVVQSPDKLLYLDLRQLPDPLGRGQALSVLPALELPKSENFVYRQPPQMKVMKTYRLEYLLSREGRDVKAPYETVEDGQKTTVIPAPPIETISASLECSPSDLSKAVALLASANNGQLFWLRIQIYDDAFHGGRGMDSVGFAEPNGKYGQFSL